MKKIIMLILSSYYLIATEAAIALEYAKADKLLYELNKCSQYNFHSCEYVEQNSNFKYEKEITDFFEYKCQNNNMAACYLFAYVSNDDKTLYKLLKFTCQNNFDLACSMIISKFERNSNKAIKILKEQCNENNIHSCKILSNYFIQYMDYENAAVVSKKACDNNFYDACIINANCLFKLAKNKQALDILTKSCEDKYDEACLAMIMYYENYGDLKKAKIFLEKSCKLNNKNSCKKLKGI